MIVRTVHVSAKTRDEFWPLLCNARMDGAPSCWFRAGVPRPVQCRLPDQVGGVGARRECISDKGVIHQVILVWDPPHILSFRMEETTLYFRPCVPEIIDTFELTPIPTGGTRVIRTTQFAVTGRCRWAKTLAVSLGLKRVHRYVFRNWDQASLHAA